MKYGKIPPNPISINPVARARKNKVDTFIYLQMELFGRLLSQNEDIILKREHLEYVHNKAYEEGKNRGI